MSRVLEIDAGARDVLSVRAIQAMRQRSRIIQMLDAAEHVAISPLRTRRLHAFAYLADVLSPVWNMPAFDGKVLKIEGGPHYPDLQREVDRLAILGLINISDVKYVSRPDGGARIDALYSLNLDSPMIPAILGALGARGRNAALDPRDSDMCNYLLDLAGALATVPEEEIEKAAAVDATYSDRRVDLSNIIDFGRWSSDIHVDNLSLRTVERFRQFLPDDASLGSGEKLYLYASFLGRRVNAR